MHEILGGFKARNVPQGEGLISSNTCINENKIILSTPPAIKVIALFPIWERDERKRLPEYHKVGCRKTKDPGNKKTPFSGCRKAF
jgi:hypothetical protein